MAASACFLRAVRPAGEGSKVAESGWGRVAGYEALPGGEEGEGGDEEGLEGSDTRDEDKVGHAGGRTRTPSPSREEGRSSSVDLIRPSADAQHPRSRALAPPPLASYDSAEAEVGLAGLAEEGELGARTRDRSVASVRTLGVNEVDIYGADMVRHGDFWLVCAILVLRECTHLFIVHRQRARVRR